MSPVHKVKSGKCFSSGLLPPPVTDQCSVSVAEGRMDAGYDVTAGMRTVAEQELSRFQNRGRVLPVWSVSSSGEPAGRAEPCHGVLFPLLCCVSADALSQEAVIAVPVALPLQAVTRGFRPLVAMFFHSRTASMAEHWENISGTLHSPVVAT